MNCPNCLKNLALVGIRHNCTGPIVANSSIRVANKEEPVANEIYARYRDKEKRRSYMRDYMKKRRSQKREPISQSLQD